MAAQAPLPLPRPTFLRALRVVTVLAVLGFCVSTVPGVRSTPGFDVPFDGWLQGTCYALLAGVILLRPALTRANRTLWGLLAGAVTARSLGFVITLGFLRRMDPPPYPSVADVFWVLSSMLLLVLLASRIRQFAPRLTVLVVLDGLIGALVTGAITLLVLARALELSTAGTPGAAVAVNVLYPALDVSLLVVAATAVLLLRSRLTRVDGVVIGAIAAFAVVDVVYLLALADGTWRPGTLLSALSLLATSSLAFCAWIQPRRAALPPPDVSQEPSVVVTAALAVVCVGVFVLDDVVKTPVSVVVLTATALVLALARGMLTLTTDRRYAGRVLGATNEELLRFQALVEASSDLIAIADPSGRLLYLNPGGRQMVGLEPHADVTTMRIPDLLPPEAHEFWRTVRHPAILRDGHWQGETRLRPVDGRPDVPVAASSFVIRDPDAGTPFAMASIQRDISERLRAQTALTELANQRARLLTRLVAAQEDERSRVAADVHDDSVQALAAVELRLGVLRRRLEVDAPELVATVDALNESVGSATTRLRHLLFDLESPARSGALADALKEAGAFIFEDTDIRWRVIGELDLDVPQATRVTAYRVAKEALVNVVRHARARTVVVELASQDGGIAVSVRDDGGGIEPGADHERPGHLGLASMRDRALVAGGHLEVRPADGGGTVVRVWLPLPAEQPADLPADQAGPDR